MFLFGRPDQIHIEMCVIDLSFSLKANSRSVLCVLFLCFPVLPFFYFGLDFGLDGLDVTMILYAILACFVT